MSQLHGAGRTARFPVAPVVWMFCGFVAGIIGCTTAHEARLDPLLFPDLGDWRPAASTSSDEARRWFDQGSVFYWGFNHKEAERSFARAFELDPTFALAAAFEALADGPNINSPEMSEQQSESAFAAARRALGAATATTSPRDRAIIDAVLTRYSSPPPADRSALNQAYATAMRAAHHRFPKDAEIATLFAESMLDLRPWDQWTHDGTPQEGTLECVAALDVALDLEPNHPGANHLYIHALEGSTHPERAMVAADRLRTLVPGIAHLVHMPAHIDVRTGRYAEAIATNERAVEVDRAYNAVRPRTGIYAMYRAHNPHFIVFAAMFAGNKKEALRGLDILDEVLAPAVVASLPDVLDGFLVTRDHVYVRFGMWNEILALPDPPASSPLRQAMRHYSRGVALAALSRVDAALVEQSAYAAAAAKVDSKTMVGNNPASLVLSIGAAQLRGEIEYRRGRYDAAFEHLREATRLYDSLRYDEPSSWVMPPRHALGALLLEQGKAEEALVEYRADLVANPENVWSLQGLTECLTKLDRGDEAAAARARFDKARAGADIEIAVSCFCRR